MLTADELAVHAARRTLSRPRWNGACPTSRLDMGSAAALQDKHRELPGGHARGNVGLIVQAPAQSLNSVPA